MSTRALGSSHLRPSRARARARHEIRLNVKAIDNAVENAVANDSHLDIHTVYRSDADFTSSGAILESSLQRKTPRRLIKKWITSIALFSSSVHVRVHRL